MVKSVAVRLRTRLIYLYKKHPVRQQINDNREATDSQPRPRYYCSIAPIIPIES